jgi:hypothetical protein
MKNQKSILNLLIFLKILKQKNFLNIRNIYLIIFYYFKLYTKKEIYWLIGAQMSPFSFLYASKFNDLLGNELKFVELPLPPVGHGNRVSI